jgi:NADH-quinone oxidoreductase subunit E
MMVNWEFFDNQTPESAIELVDGLRSGATVRPTRGATLCTFKQVSRVLAGFPDGRSGEGPAAGPATLAGLELFRAQQQDDEQRTGQRPATGTAPATGYGNAGGPSSSDGSMPTAESDSANPTPAATEKDGEQ